MTHFDFRQAAGKFVDVVRSTHGYSDVEAGLAAVTGLAVELGLADHAGITERVDDGEFRTQGATDEVVAALDRLQYELKQGPCVQASYEDDVLVSNDVAEDPRWPQWGPRASRRGIGAVMSVSLYASGDAMGALNLYAAKPMNYSRDELDVARLAGAHASIVLAHGRDGQHLWKAIDARHRIGQAQGVIMERYQVSAEQAFALLRRLSQQSNTKLHLVAHSLLTSGHLPDAAVPSKVASDHDVQSSGAVGVNEVQNVAGVD